MGRKFVRIIVRNESTATLRLRTRWASHTWTGPNWSPDTFPSTPPGGALQWQCEGEQAVGVPLTGAEARVWYDVVDANGRAVGDLYIFADAPWVESQYGVKYIVRAPPGYYATYVDARGQMGTQGVGDHAILEIRFRNTKRVSVKGFKPSIHGFQFGNHWSKNLPVITLGSLWNRFADAITGGVAEFLGIGKISEDWIPITDASAGLCGGMTFAVMDYFNGNLLPPELAIDANDVPAAPGSSNDPLFLFIRERLLDSFDMTGRGHRWLSYTSPAYPDGDEGVVQFTGLMKGRSWVTYREEWPLVREQLDQGKLVTVGLVQSDNFDIGANHQVLAYAYEQSGQQVKLWVYDPNLPGPMKKLDASVEPDDLRLEFDITDTSGRVHVKRCNYDAESTNKPIYAILYMDHYVPHLPPLGRALPPPAVHKALKLVEADAESITVDGEVTKEDTNKCGEPKRQGVWTMRTRVSLVAQVSGYMDPVLAWKVNGAPVPAKATALTVQVNGTTFSIDARVHPGGRALTLESAPGDTYDVPVVVELRDALGATAADQRIFEVEGKYEGIRVEDIRAEAQCFVRNIPVPVEDWTPPHELEQGQDWKGRLKEWAKDTLERLKVDPSINETTRAALKDYVNVQVNERTASSGRVRLGRGVNLKRTVPSSRTRIPRQRLQRQPT